MKSLDLVVVRSTTRPGDLSLRVRGHEAHRAATPLYEWLTKHCKVGDAVKLRVFDPSRCPADDSSRANCDCSPGTCKLENGGAK